VLAQHQARIFNRLLPLLGDLSENMQAYFGAQANLARLEIKKSADNILLAAILAALAIIVLSASYVGALVLISYLVEQALPGSTSVYWGSVIAVNFFVAIALLYSAKAGLSRARNFPTETIASLRSFKTGNTDSSVANMVADAAVKEDNGALNL